MDFFARIAIAVAVVEDHIASQGYYDEIDLEQSVFRATQDVFDYADAQHKHLLPSCDLLGRPW